MTSIQQLLLTITLLCQQLQETNNIDEQLAILENDPLAQQFLKKTPEFQQYLDRCDKKTQFVLYSVLAVGQGPTLFREFATTADSRQLMRELEKMLLHTEVFYAPIGGVVGYYLTILKLIESSVNQTVIEQDHTTYLSPQGIDLTERSQQVDDSIVAGLELMGQMAEIYPIGGAGDRLGLKDEMTGEPLPAAQLLFCGRTLLEGMIRDLQGREYLHYQLFGRQLATPLAIMTSHEKGNHQRILELCGRHHWFGRPKESFIFFVQEQVPMVTKDGDWAMQGPLHPWVKPGGHGVVWKLAYDQGVFDWLKKHRRKKALVRQINNPIAGVDHGLLSLIGIGCVGDKDFGFASCPRLVQAPEGMNVLRERQSTNVGYDYTITNVEYTEFQRYGIVDQPKEKGSPYSLFPANTNILFVDLDSVSVLCHQHPIPGMLINMKSTVSCYMGEGHYEDRQAARLESTMQNLADEMTDYFSEPLKDGEEQQLRTFLTYNERRKTISVVKQSYSPDKSMQGTPEGAFYELMQNYEELLGQHCQMQLPPHHSEEKYLREGPSFIALFHPALGGLYSVVGQKIQGGRIGLGSEWIMEIAEARVLNLDLQGSLIVEADAVMGDKNAQGETVYNHRRAGKCQLINVTVRNAGVKSLAPEQAWRQEMEREEALRILIHGNGEFLAQDVTLSGELDFEVPEGHRLVVYERDGMMRWHCEKIDAPSWNWEYFIEGDNKIKLLYSEHSGNT